MQLLVTGNKKSYTLNKEEELILFRDIISGILLK